MERWRKPSGIILMKCRIPGEMEAGGDLYSRYVKNGWAKEKGESSPIPTWSHESTVGFLLSVSPDPEMHPLFHGTVLVLTHTVSRASATFPLPLSTHQICLFWNQEHHSSLSENSSMPLLFTCALHTRITSFSCEMLFKNSNTYNRRTLGKTWGPELPPPASSDVLGASRSQCEVHSSAESNGIELPPELAPAALPASTIFLPLLSHKLPYTQPRHQNVSRELTTYHSDHQASLSHKNLVGWVLLVPTHLNYLSCCHNEGP